MRPTVHEALCLLEDAVASGALTQLCDWHGVDLVVLFGRAVDGDDPGDIDLAVSFGRRAGKDFLATVTDLLALVPGDHLDVMDLDRADPVGRYAAMTGGRLLFARTPASRNSTSRQPTIWPTWVYGCRSNEC